MKKLFLSLAVVLTAAAGWAQDTQIYKAQEQIGENRLKEAQATMAEVLVNPKTKKMAYAYNVAGQVELRLLNEEMSKYSSRQPLDTVAFVNCLDKAVEYLLKSYELDNQPDAKGKVKPKFNYGDKYTIGESNGNIVWLKKVLGYYLIAAQMEYSNGNDELAYKYYTKHLEFPKCPIFTPAETDSIYKSDDRYPIVGYYATIIAFKQKDYDKVLKTVDYAINSTDQVTREDGYHMKTTALLQKGDTAQWIEVLKDAMENTNNVNYPQIILKYYYDKHDQAMASKIADEFVAKAPQNKMAHYIKGVVLMDEGKDTEARQCFETAIKIDSAFVEAISNLGVTYFNEVRTLNSKATTDNKAANYKSQQLELKAMLQKTKGYFEQAQAISPDRPDLWQSKLDNINELIEVVDKNLSEIAKRDKKK
jgi:tetratricopeptide (TPR) repeat protein